MSDPIIRVENLSKRYLISHKSGARDGLRHRLEQAMRSPVRWLTGLNREKRATQEEFWALRDVSFDVHQGEVVGFIGRNGAGKSTLLKILSRITEPTSGRISIEGRVASLLEVGTGFHPELTGRENIFLNGAILGMHRTEIQQKFDEIVAFAEVEKFLDTPVKRYSSGMYVRLAFAVAAHLEPEILIIDEVLAVGDAQFQKKCLGKMQDVADREGRTVLFVSHNLSTIRQLCTKGVLLENGKATVKGTVNEVTDRYLQSILESKRAPFAPIGTGYTGMRLVNSAGLQLMAMTPDHDTFVELALRITAGSNVHAGFTIFNQMDVPLVLCASEYGGVELKRGEYTYRVRLPNELFQPGTYRIEGAVWEGDHVFHKEDYLCHFQVMPTRLHELQGRSSAAQFVSREPWLKGPAVLQTPSESLRDSDCK